MLFERQLDIEADGGCAHVVCAAVTRFHDAGAAAGHQGESLVLLVGPTAKFRAEFMSGVIVFGDKRKALETHGLFLVLAIFQAFLNLAHGERTRRTEEHDGVLDAFLGKNLVRTHEFRKNSDRTANIAINKFGVMVDHLAWSKLECFLGRHIKLLVCG